MAVRPAVPPSLVAKRTHPRPLLPIAVRSRADMLQRHVRRDRATSSPGDMHRSIVGRRTATLPRHAATPHRCVLTPLPHHAASLARAEVILAATTRAEPVLTAEAVLIPAGAAAIPLAAATTAAAHPVPVVTMAAEEACPAEAAITVAVCPPEEVVAVHRPAVEVVALAAEALQPAAVAVTDSHE